MGHTKALSRSTTLKINLKITKADQQKLAFCYELTVSFCKYAELLH